MLSENAIVELSHDGLIVTWNAGAEKLFGYPPGEAIGNSITLLIPQERLEEHQEILAAVGRGEEAARPDTVRMHKSGKWITVSLTCVPLPEQDGKRGAVMVAHDITQFRKLQNQMLHNQKMDNFARLAAGVAHDFNNILTVIMGSCELFISRFRPSEAMRALLAEIYLAGQRAHNLTRQLLALGHRRTPQPVPLDLNHAIRDGEKMLHRILEANIALTIRMTPELWRVKMDPGQVQQIILSLAINARDAMPAGGRLTIETTKVTLDASNRQNDPPLPPGNYALLSFTDTGSGMSPEARASLLEALRSPNGQVQSVDFGLAAVQAIVAAGGGWLDMHSDPDKGSTFKVYLPETLEPPQTGQLNLDFPASPRGNETILVVEDDALMRATLKDMLQECGYTVLEAGTGLEAMEVATGHPGLIDLVVTDVIMPALSGLQFAESLLALNPLFKVLFLSGYPHETILQHNFVRPDSPFLQKPFTATALAKKVREILSPS